MGIDSRRLTCSHKMISSVLLLACFVGAFASYGARDTVVVTQTRTVDEIETRINTVYNTLQVTQTDFVLQTITSQTYQVIRTPGNNDVRISTVAAIQGTVAEVTDVWRDYYLNTQYASRVVSVVHEVQNIDFVTVTRTVNEEITVQEQVIQTQVVTDYRQETDYRYVTHYEYVHAGGYGGNSGGNFGQGFGSRGRAAVGSGYY